MLRIGVDAMGGDFAPQAAVEGAVMAARAVGDRSRIVLFGDRSRIEPLLPADMGGRVEVIHASEVIEMGDHPAKAFQQKTDSSIVAGFGHLAAGRIDGFASAGSTGAMMVGSMLVVKPIEGILRPTISSTVPTARGGRALLLDVGLNVDCTPEMLEQYALIGSIYAEQVLGIQKPRVGIVSIGEEPAKGNAQSKAAHELMAKSSRYNFIGNVEGSHLFSGAVADVFVCDGFVGNTLLKTTEGLYRINKSLGIADSTPFWQQMNYEQVGGTPVLGVGAPVVIGHGCSTPLAIMNMILTTELCAQADLTAKLRHAFR